MIRKMGGFRAGVCRYEVLFRSRAKAREGSDNGQQYIPFDCFLRYRKQGSSAEEQTHTSSNTSFLDFEFVFSGLEKRVC
jgi:hypothetical protein